MPDASLFPTDAFRRVLNRVIRKEGRELLQYYPARGYPPLREYLAAYLAALRGGGAARGDPDRQRLAAGLRPRRADAARSGRLRRDRAAVVPARDAGVPGVRRPAPARSAGRAAGSASTISSGSSSGSRRSSSTASRAPTTRPGVTMPAAARQRLLEVAARHRLPDRGGRLRRHALLRRAAAGARSRPWTAPGSSSTSGRSRRSCSRGSASAGSWRAPELIERLELAKELADIHTSPLIQAAVYHFCRERLLERHQARVLGSTARRRSALLAALARRMPPACTWTEAQGGFSLLRDAAGGAGRRARCCRARWRAASPSRRAASSSSTAAASGRCGCPSRPCRRPRSTRASRASPRRSREAQRQPEPAARARARRAAGLARSIMGSERMSSQTLAARGGRDVRLGQPAR